MSEKQKETPQDSRSEPDSCEQKLQEAENKYRYLYADFDNYKKRAAQERFESVRYATEPIASDLLEVADSLERAMAFASPETDANLIAGLKLTLSQLTGTLAKHGIRRVQAVGQLFDPNLHESTGYAPSDQAKGTVVEEQLPGYTIHDRLLRPARVLISAGTQEADKSA